MVRGDGDTLQAYGKRYMRAMGLLAWSGYWYDAYAITAFAFVPSVSWAPSTSIGRSDSRLPSRRSR